MILKEVSGRFLISRKMLRRLSSAAAGPRDDRTLEAQLLIGIPSSAYLVCHLNDLRRCTDGSTGDDATVFGNSARLNNCNIQTVVGLLLGVESVHQIDREHAQMLVKKFDVAIVDTLCNLLADLVGCTTLDHVELGPAVLGLCT